MALSPGQILNNRYRIVKMLGQGGFGAVYRAWDTNLERPRAIKENLDTSPEAQRQFKREAQILDKLLHPNLPRVIDHFIIPGQGQYLVMDFVEGQDLQEMLNNQGGPLPEAQVLEWASQVCDALNYLHNQNPPVIHRDIKPANIRITPQGKAMLVDFGIAKIFDSKLKTTQGARAVTPGYSPQEQYGMGTTDARTDVYALGATLYHLLTGKQPPESVQRTIGVQLEVPSKLNPAISTQVQNTILKAMELIPDNRFQSMSVLHQALLGSEAIAQKQPVRVQTQAVGGATAPVSSVPIPTMLSTVSKPLPWKWIGAMAALGLIALLIYVLYDTGRTEKAAFSTASDTATFPAVAIIATTSIPFSSTLPAVTSSNFPTAPPTSTNTPPLSSTPTETLSPTLLPGRITDEKGVEMALIPAGAFQMGSEMGASDERPVHEVYLDEFYMDVYEVTNARYAECVTASMCETPTQIKSYTRSSYYGNLEYADYSVIYVTWFMAQAYCEWRGGSLPTEAQWEKAARGGLEGMAYPWGDEAPTCTAGAKNGANYVSCSPDDTMAVGSFGPNGYGLYDVAGNVWEWVLDWFSSTFYDVSPRDNPSSHYSGYSRVLRGGAWNNNEWGVRAARRGWNTPADTNDSIGLRCSHSRAPE